MITKEFEMEIISIKDVTFAYSEGEEPVFENFSLAVNSGECLVIQGDNGSGKSTLFRIINGLSFPQAGSYTFDGKEITKSYLKDNSASKLFHKRVGYLFQNPDVMLFNTNVYSEVAFGPRQMGFDDGEVDKRTGDCLRLFDIENLKDKAPYHLSGGQKKKVALASVIALNPDVLVLDEPFAGLDEKTQALLTDLLKEMKQAGKTLIISTHSDALTQSLADRVINL